MLDDVIWTGIYATVLSLVVSALPCASGNAIHPVNLNSISSSHCAWNGKSLLVESENKTGDTVYLSVLTICFVWKTFWWQILVKFKAESHWKLGGTNKLNLNYILI